MTRQLRHHYAGGWYHITSRGMGRKAIFRDDRDREHFVELLSEMVGRYGEKRGRSLTLDIRELRSVFAVW